MEGQYAQNVFEAAIIPAATGFVICASVLLGGVLRPVPRPHPWRPLAGRRRLAIARTLRLFGAGYLAFLLIVLVYSHLLQHEPTALSSAAWGAPFLMAITTPVWIGLTCAATFLAGRAGRSEHRDDAGDGTGPKSFPRARRASTLRETESRRVRCSHSDGSPA
jgi:hypothetical protein